MCLTKNIKLLCIQTPVYKSIYDESIFSETKKICHYLNIPFIFRTNPMIATLELATEDDAAVTDEPATCEALEQFRARYREMREHSIFAKKTNQ